MKEQSAPRKSLSLRVSPAVMKELSRLAEEQHLLVSHMGERLIVESLGNQPIREEVEQLHEEVRALQDQVGLLRADLVTALAYCLTLTERTDQKTARQIAEKVFRGSDTTE